MMSRICLLGWLSAMVLLSAGCRRVDRREVYRIARAHVEQQLGDDVEIGTQDEALFAVGKNAARVDLDYRRSGANPVEGYITVWCKRIRMRWEMDRAIDHRNSGRPNG